MDADSVDRLARREREMWSHGAVAAASEVLAPGGLGAYVPLGATGEPRPRITFVDMVAVGTTLVFLFRWPLDEKRRDFFLLVDFRSFPGDEIGAGTWLLEYIEQHIQFDTSWFPRDLVDISESAAIVRLARQPGA